MKNREDLLLGELKEFKAYTIREMREMRTDIKSLLQFKWRAVGVLSGLVILIEVAFKMAEVALAAH